MKGCAVIVECLSNGRYYVGDVLDEGLIPLMLFRRTSEDEKGSEYAQLCVEMLSELPSEAEVVYYTEDLDGIVNGLKGRDVRCVVAGSEFGVGLADRIADRLGLPGNPAASIPSRTSKNGMHRALKAAGLRYLRGGIVTSEQDVRDVWAREGLKIAVLKFAVSAASTVVRCESVEEAVLEFSKFRMYENFFRDQQTIILQEYVHGREYIVNTLSSAGKHKLLHVWSNDKVVVGDFGIAQDRAVLTEEFPGRDELVDYTMKVLDATEVKYGMSHVELSIDDDGPVLIEINARIMGGFFPRSVMDDAFGDHMTDLSLQTYLHPERFADRPVDGVRASGTVGVKCISLPYDMIGDQSPFAVLMSKIEGFNGIDPVLNGVRDYQRTINLPTSAFAMSFTMKDHDSMQSLFDTVVECESDFPDLIITPPEYLIGDTSGMNTGKDFNLISSNMITFYDALGSFISKGGSFISGSSCSCVPYGRQGMIMLLRLLGRCPKISGDGLVCR